MVGSKHDIPLEPDTLSSSLAIRPADVRAHVVRQGLGHSEALLEIERLREALEVVMRLSAGSLRSCTCSFEYEKIARAALSEGT